MPVSRFNKKHNNKYISKYVKYDEKMKDLVKISKNSVLENQNQNKLKIDEYSKKLNNLDKDKPKNKLKINKYSTKIKELSNMSFGDKFKLENDLKIDKYSTKIKNMISKKIFNDKDKLFDLENDLNKLGNITILPTKAYSKSYNMFRVVLAKDNIYQPLTKNEIFKTGKKISQILKNYNLSGSIETTLNFDGYVRSSNLTSIGNDIKIFNPSDFYDENEYKDFDKIDKFNSASLYIYAKNPNMKLGGRSENNDCLWYCINNTIPQYNPWSQAYKLKNFLGLKKKDLISIDDMYKIESKIGKVGINVSGDWNYTSKLGVNQNIFLILENNHFTINHKINRKAYYVSYKEKTILLHDKLNKQGYNGKEYINIDDELLDDIRNFRTEYILVPKKKDEPMEIQYTKYIEMAERLKKESNDDINLFKTGTIKKTALNLLDQTTKHISTENILFDEALIIENSTRNGLIFNEEYEGKAYKGDITSMYPYIYSSNNSLVPIQRGEYKTLSNNDIIEMNQKLKGGYAYGHYKYIIHKSDNPLIDRLFRFNTKTVRLYDDEETNSTDFYTSIDLVMADMLGLKKELIETPNNALLYPRKKCLTGFQVFNQFVEKLKPLKENKIEGAKLTMNIMSGSIGEINGTKLYIKDDSSDFYDLDQMNLRILTQSHTVDRKTQILKCVNKDYYYRSQLARFKPFLLANARMMMLKLVLPVNHLVKKVYIDSIISTEALNYSNEFGKIKFEYEKNIKIVSNRKEIFLD